LKNFLPRERSRRALCPANIKLNCKHLMSLQGHLKTSENSCTRQMSEFRQELLELSSLAAGKICNVCGGAGIKDRMSLVGIRYK
jgi:hypothetical protein